MKKLLLLGLLSGMVCAEDISVKDNIAKTTTSIKKSTGIIKEYYENGKTRSEISYKGDILNGISKEYYETGKLTAQISYKEGMLDGILKEYYRTGKLRYEIPFKNNILNGMFKAYYKTGKLKYETPYVNGQKNGMGKIYNPSGKAKKVFFKEGTFNGTIIIKSEIGKTIIDITIKDGNVTKIL